MQAHMISRKIFFQLMVTVFKENLNLQLPLIFYSSIRFAFETVFISKQIAGNRFGTLLEISDKFITKFNVFSYMILQFRYKTVCKNLKVILYDFKSSGQVVLLERSQRNVCTTNVRDELLEMGKDLKIKYNVSSPPYKLWRNFFIKKLCMGKQLFWKNFFGDVLLGTNDQIMQVRKLMVKRFRRSRANLVFRLIDSDLGY